MQTVAEGIWRWTALHPAWEEDDDWEPTVACYAIDDGKRLVLVDPLAVPPELLEQLRARDPDCVAIILTCPWHRRDAVELSEQLGLRIYVPHPDAPDKHPVPGSVYTAGDRVSAAGAIAYPGLESNDLVLWFPNVGAVIAGDTLIERDDKLVVPTDWVKSDGTTLERVKRELRPLLELPVQTVLPTHGTPKTVEELRAALS